MVQSKGSNVITITPGTDLTPGKQRVYTKASGMRFVPFYGKARLGKRKGK